MKIVVRTPNWIGDVIFALPALESLKANYPEAEIRLAAGGRVKEIFEGEEFAGRLIPLPLSNKLKSFRESAKILKKEGFDVGLLLANSFSSALLFTAAKIPQRWGFKRDGRDLFLTKGVHPGDGEPVHIFFLLVAPEGARLEFKAARGSFHFEDLVKYIVALANEGGGSIVLGVEDSRPRRVVGTSAFPEPGRTEAGLYEQLHQRIPVEECDHDGKRVLIVHAPSRLSGTAWQYKGSFWMRTGDALVPMTDEELRRIHEEAGPDFSAEPCAKARLDDLDPGAIAVLRRLWDRKARSQGIPERPLDRLLAENDIVSLFPAVGGG